MFEVAYNIVPLRPLLARFMHNKFQIVEFHPIKGKISCSLNKKG